MAISCESTRIEYIHITEQCAWLFLIYEGWMSYSALRQEYCKNGERECPTLYCPWGVHFSEEYRGQVVHRIYLSVHKRLAW